MAHNFKLTGSVYVSIDGSDSNDGLTKDTPKRTIQAALNLNLGSTIVIGAGVYNETILYSVNTNTILTGDGLVVLNGLGNKTIRLGSGSLGAFNRSLTNLIFVNYSTDIIITAGTNAGSIGWTISNCSFIFSPLNVINGSYQSMAYIINTSFFNSNVTIGSSYISTALYSCFINSNLNYANSATLSNSYFNAQSIASFFGTPANFNYNNIQGYVRILSASAITTGVYQDIYGRYYDLSITTSTGDGTMGNPFGRPLTSGVVFSFATHRILYPTYNANSFSSDPKFNNILTQDLTLQANSPHIGKASDGINNIGGTKYALRYAAKGAEFNTSALSITGLAFVGNDWTISGGTTGEVISAPMFISSTTKVLQKISYNGLLEFNKAITPPAGGNRNVPDQEVYDSTSQPPNVAGANPDRLVYYMRYSTQTAQPTTNSEWDNGGYWTAGNYGTFEWNTKPSIDNAFLGNGDPSFNSGVTPTFLNVTWIQLKVKLRNDYA